MIMSARFIRLPSAAVDISVMENARGRETDREEIKLSDVMSALSHALDLVEGQPQGHAVRSCMIGMRIGRDYGLNAASLSSLYYALLMKDLGCSSNSSKMCYIFAADDRQTKNEIKTINWRNPIRQLGFALTHAAPGQGFAAKLKRVCNIVRTGQREAKELIQIRCERGASIARQFGLSEETALAIHSLDEHYDGAGHPDGLRGSAIPLLARILGIAQTAEVFLSRDGLHAMRGVMRARRKKWFDPQLVDLLLAVPDEDPLWQDIFSPDATRRVLSYEPADIPVPVVDNRRLDAVAIGFADVIDAKSPWTYSHSMGVARISMDIGRTMGFDHQRLRDLNQAALLHDIGKLGVPNTILDKPGKLDASELAVMRKHPAYTAQILGHVRGFRHLADMAAAHHERIDGNGYFQGRAGGDLTLEMRILSVADMFEALTASRPYRKDLTQDEAIAIVEKNSPNGVCPQVLSALKASLKTCPVPAPMAA